MLATLTFDFSDKHLPWPVLVDMPIVLLCQKASINSRPIVPNRLWDSAHGSEWFEFAPLVIVEQIISALATETAI